VGVEVSLHLLDQSLLTIQESLISVKLPSVGPELPVNPSAMLLSGTMHVPTVS
jgi:hypothetical protein